MIEIQDKTPLSALIAQGITIPEIKEYRAIEQLARVNQLKNAVGWNLTNDQAEKALAHYDYMRAKPFRTVQDSEFFYQALRIVSA